MLFHAFLPAVFALFFLFRLRCTLAALPAYPAVSLLLSLSLSLSLTLCFFLPLALR